MRQSAGVVSLCLVSPVWLFLAGAPGCSTPNNPPDAGDPGAGGTVQVAGCGYGITTRDGATAPVPGTAMLGPDPTPYAVHLAFTGDASRSMNMVWRTKDDATLATQVRFGAGDALDKSAGGYTFTYPSGNRPDSRIHEAHLCGLLPDTTYSYQVGGGGTDGKEVFSKTYKFHTAPDLATKPDAQLLVAVIGDTRDGYSTWGQALQQLVRLGPPDLILFSGDAVTLGTFQGDWDQFFLNADPILASIPLIGAAGNHDINAINYYSQFAFPGNEENFSFDYGPIHVSVLNDSPADTGDLAGKATPFLDADLKAATADGSRWRLVMHHRPLWSASMHGGDPKLRALFGPVIDTYHADLVLNGHDHDYERTWPMRGDQKQPSPKDGTVYVIAGSAGAELYDNGTGAWTAVSKKTHSMLLLQVRRKALDLRAFSADTDMPFDSFSLTRP